MNKIYNWFAVFPYLFLASVIYESLVSYNVIIDIIPVPWFKIIENLHLIGTIYCFIVSLVLIFTYHFIKNTKIKIKEEMRIKYTFFSKFINVFLVIIGSMVFVMGNFWFGAFFLLMIIYRYYILKMLDINEVKI